MSLALVILTACTSSKAPLAGRGMLEVRAGNTTVSAAAQAVPPGSSLRASSLGGRVWQAHTAGAQQAFATAAGTGVSITLDGQQPRSPLTIRFTVSAPSDPALSPAVLVVPDDGGPEQLLPATYDRAARTMTATTPHLTSFFPQWLKPSLLVADVANTLSTVWQLSSPKPACAGRPAAMGDGRQIALPAVYAQEGDGIAWPCLKVTAEQVTLSLTANSGLPYRVRATGSPQVGQSGTVDVARAAQLAIYDTLLRSPHLSESLLVPTTSTTLTWPTNGLPVQVALQADALMHLAFIGAAAVSEVISVAAGGSTLDRLVSASGLASCLSDVVAVLVPNADDRGPSKLTTALVGNVLKGSLSCLSQISGSVLEAGLAATVGVVIAIVTTGLGALAASVEGLARTWTGRDGTGFTLTATSLASHRERLSLLGSTAEVALTVPVEVGQQLSYSASGVLQYGYEGAGCIGYPLTDPDGNRTVDGRTCDPKYDPNVPLPSAPVAALLVRIGTYGEWKLAGSQGRLTAPTSGTVYFAYNDGYRADDTAGFTIDVTVGP